MAKIDLKIKRTKAGEIPSSPEYPSLYLSDTPLPITKKDIGKTMKVVATLKFTGYREDNSTKKNHISYDFAVKSIEFSGRDIAENNAGKKLKEVFGGK